MAGLGSGLAGRLAAGCVSILHVAFVLFMTWAPFSNNRTALVLHLVLTPCLWVHWILNDDTCALTLLEKRLRGIEDDSCSFFHALVSPVYKVRDRDVRELSWLASVVLWLVTLSRVGWNDISTVFGLSGLFAR